MYSRVCIAAYLGGRSPSRRLGSAREAHGIIDDKDDHPGQAHLTLFSIFPAITFRFQ
jgi:hypothetical protein